MKNNDPMGKSKFKSMFDEGMSLVSKVGEFVSDNLTDLDIDDGSELINLAKTIGNGFKNGFSDKSVDEPMVLDVKEPIEENADNGSRKKDENKKNKSKKTNSVKKSTDDGTGPIQAIAEDLTSAKLKQAVIFSEIIGQPVSRKRRNSRGR
ncbi:MAG: hypothetical protein ACRCW0_03565 [Clostridium sp.]